MKKLTLILPEIARYFFILLFCYAAISKVLDFENFQVQIAQSPLLSAYAGLISYAVIITELIIVGLLAFNRSIFTGLLASTALMTAFTVYIYLILEYSDFIPCSCGGILEKLGWKEHLIFNIVAVLLGAFASLKEGNNRLSPKRKTASALLLTNILSAVTVTVLFLTSDHIIKKENNFTRRYLIHPVIQDKILNLKVNSYYFAGTDQEKIYLGNLTSPFLLTTVHHDLSNFRQEKLNVPDKDYAFRNIQLQVDQKNFYLSDGSVPIIYRGTTADKTARVISYKDAYFTQLSVIDTVTFALRTQNRQNMQYTLGLLRLHPSPTITLKPDILQKQTDGVFDSDGHLIKIQNTKEKNRQFLYPYSYRNQFMVMDEMLNLKARFRTIDTTSMAQIKVTKMRDGRRKMGAPPLKINRSSTAHRNLLFLESGSLGMNESKAAWKNSSVVDLYFTDRQEYAGSFYIEKRDGHSISKMLATDDYLFVLTGNELIRYRFTAPIKKLYRSGEAENLNKE